MTTEEEFNKSLDFVIREIKFEHLSNPKSMNVYFEIQDRANLPSTDNQRRAIRYLENTGAISITYRQRHQMDVFSSVGAMYGWKPIGYKLHILQPKFEEISKRIQNGKQLENIKTYIRKHTEKDKNNLSEPISVKVASGTLEINKNTGKVKLNDYEKVLNPESQEFFVLALLATSMDYQATYKDFLGNSPSKYGKRTLGFTIRNLKRTLDILPKNNAKNKDIIKNIKHYGYKLITS